MDIAMAFVENEKYEQAESILNALYKKATQYFAYYMSLPDYYFRGSVRECYSLMTITANISQTYADMAETDKHYQQLADDTEVQLERMYQPFANRCAAMGIRLQ